MIPEPVTGSGTARTVSDPTGNAAQRLQAERLVDADGETGMLDDPPNAEQHAGHERLARQRVVPDRQRLTMPAEENFLMRDQPGQADRVDVDTGEIGAARSLQ